MMPALLKRSSGLSGRRTTGKSGLDLQPADWRHMEKRNTLTKILAILGTLFAWVPLLAPIFFSLMRLLQAGRFQFDYLLPAELFPLAWLGGGLLIWAAIRARLRIQPI